MLIKLPREDQFEGALIHFIKGLKLSIPPGLNWRLLLLAAICLRSFAAAEEPARMSVSFINEVMPLLAKAGCSSGACHAKPEGQNNFKLSVFGYDQRLDFNEIVNDARSRRVFFAAPEESLLLLKATGQIPHDGGGEYRRTHSNTGPY